MLLSAGFCCEAFGQHRTEADFRSDGYAAPVHIPPRVPKYDPGLPATLNGKFNSTQVISSDSRSGLRTVINDFTQPQRSGRSSRTRTRPTASQPVAAPAVQQQDFPTYAVNQPRPVQRSTRTRQRGGLQDRISGLAAKKAAPTSRNYDDAPQQTIVRQRPQPRTYQAPALQPMQIAHAASKQAARTAPAPEQIYAEPQQRRYVAQQNTRPAVQPRQSTTKTRNYQPALLTSTGSQRSVPSKNTVTRQRRAPAAAKAPVRQPTQVRQVALQQSGQDGNFVRRAQGQFKANAANRGASNFVSPRDAATAFKQSINFNSPPKTVQRRSPAQSVSVLKSPGSDQPNVGLDANEPLDMLQPPADTIENNSVFSNDAYEAAEPAGVNSLRAFESSHPYQADDEEDDALRSDFGDDDDDFGDSLDDDLGDDFGDDDEDDRPALAQKSCAELRNELLNTPLTSIALNISPQPPERLDAVGGSVFRVWRDQYGNELAQGTMAGLSRGYVLVNSSAGGQVRLPFARLGDDEWFTVSQHWRLPIECGLGVDGIVARNWAPQTATWHASSLCHKPLYFENRQLERYGHTHGPFLQPIASTVHFFGKLFFLPYNTSINPPNECQYALGFYRPGNCAPWLKDPFPYSLTGTVRQVGFWTGIGFLPN